MHQKRTGHLEYHLVAKEDLHKIPDFYTDSEQHVHIEVNHELRGSKFMQDQFGGPVYDPQGHIMTSDIFVTVLKLKKDGKNNKMYGYSFLRDLTDEDKTHLTLLGVQLNRPISYTHLATLPYVFLYGKGDVPVD